MDLAYKKIQGVMQEMRIDLCFQKIQVCFRLFHFKLQLLRFQNLSLFLSFAQSSDVSDQETHAKVKHQVDHHCKKHEHETWIWLS